MNHREEVGSGSEGTAAYPLWLGYGVYGGQLGISRQVHGMVFDPQIPGSVDQALSSQ